MFAALSVLPQASKFNSSSTQPLDPETKFKEEYDYGKIPADIHLAKIHGISKRVYADGNKESKTCQCCGLPVSGEKISLGASLNKLAHLGSGYPLYFKFIKYSIGMLIMMFLVGSIYNLVTNKESEDCYDNIENAQGLYCVKGYIHSYIISNKRDNEKDLRIQAILNLVTIIIVMFFFHYLRYQIRKLNVEADEKTVTPSDYTIELQDIPEETTDEEIKKFIYQLDGQVEIARVTRTHPISKYVKLIEKKSKYEMKKAKLDSKANPKKEHQRSTVLAKLNSLDQKINLLEGTDHLKKCPVVYVTFKTAQQAETIRNLKKADDSKFYHIFFSQEEFTTHDFGEGKIKMRRAPEPTDILWENIEYIGQERLKTRLLTYIGTFMVTCFGIILVVNFLQGKAQSHYGKSSGIAQGLSIVVSLVIFLTNSILALIIKYLTSFEKHITYTHYLRGVAQKLAIAQFLNTALTNLFAQLILAKTDSVSSSLENLNFYGKGGLLENMYYVFITNAFLPPLLNIFDSGYFLKLFKRHLLEKKGSSNKMTQMRANSLYEGPNFDLPLKYAGMIKTVLLATFYAPAIPFSLIYTIIGLGLWFWTDKWVLLRRLVLPKSINNDLTDSMVEYLEWAVFTFAAGNIVYAYTLKNSENEFAFDTASRVLVWFALGISLFHIYFPMEALNRRLLPVHQKACETKTFNEARLNFPTDYDIENPLTHTSALKRHIQRLSKSMDPQIKERAMLLQGLKAGFLGVVDFLAVPKSEANSEKSTIQHKETRDMEEIFENEEAHPIDWNFLHIYTRKIQENQQDALVNSGIKKVPIIGQLVRGLYAQKPKNQNHNQNQKIPAKVDLLTQNVDNRDYADEDDRLATPSGNKIYPIPSAHNTVQ